MMLSISIPRALALASMLAISCASETSPSDAGARSCPIGDCTAEGFECGEVELPDGTCKRCGLCEFPKTCGGGGTAHQCGCTPRSCLARGFNCGQFVDPCSRETLECGTCILPDICGGGATENRCGRIAKEGERCDDDHPCEPMQSTSCCSNGTDAVCTPTLSRGECPNGPLPDLVVSGTIAAASTRIQTETFEADHCAVEDGCVASGVRRLLRFATQTTNIGDADLVLGDPLTSEYADDFSFHACIEHATFHYADWVEYRLLDATDREVAKGGKAGFCIEDGIPPATTSTPTKRFGCGQNEAQGIQAGWSDVYAAGMDCQWLDVTDVPSGRYELELRVNPATRFLEKSFENNVTRVGVEIP